MLDNIIDKNIIFLKNHGVKINNDDDRAVYKYGLQILYYYVIDLVVIFLLAAVFDRLYETVIMTFIFGLFQVFGGGYHAKTPMKCLTTMVIGAAAGNFIIMLIADKFMISMILSVVLSVILLILAPVTNKKHSVSTKIKQRSKLMLTATVIVNLTAIIILSYFNIFEATVFTVTLILYFISLIMAKT